MATKTKGPQPPPADAQLLTLEEVAYVLRVSVASVRRLVAAGDIPHVPATVKGAAKRVLRETLDSYIRGQERKAPADAPAPAAPKLSLMKAGWDGVDRLAPRPRRAKGQG